MNSSDNREMSTSSIKCIIKDIKSYIVRIYIVIDVVAAEKYCVK